MFLLTEVCALCYQLSCDNHFKFAEIFKSLVVKVSFQCWKNGFFFSVSMPDHDWMQGVSGSFSCKIILHVNLLPGLLVHNNFHIYRHIRDCELPGL